MKRLENPPTVQTPVTGVGQDYPGGNPNQQQGALNIHRHQQLAPGTISYIGNNGPRRIVTLSNSPMVADGSYSLIPLAQHLGSGAGSRGLISAPPAPTSANDTDPRGSLLLGPISTATTTSSAPDDLDLEQQGPVEQPEPLSVTFQVLEEKNRFQMYSPQFIQLLETPPKERQDKIHGFQREAVLKAMTMANGDDPKQPLLPIVIVAPPGSGKTGMVVMLPYAIPCKRTLILTPSPILSTQIAESFGLFRETKSKSFFEVAGIWTPEQLDTLLGPVSLVTGKLKLNERLDSACVIVNAQKFGGQSSTTLNPRLAKEGTLPVVERYIEQSDLLIVDEAHHYPAETWTRIIEVAKRAQAKDEKKRTVIFLSATFEKQDRTPILSDVGGDRIAYTVTLDQLEGKVVRSLRFQEEGTLEDPKMSNPATFAKVAKDIQAVLASQHKMEPRFPHQAMVIVRTKTQAQAWTNGLNEAVNNSKFAIKIIGDKDSQKRTDDFSDGEYQVAVICNLLKEGYSNPKVSVGVVLRNIGSRVLFDQFVGRAMRFNRDIKGKTPDRSVGIIMSYTDFGQKEMWESRLQLAVHDPIVEEDEAEEEIPVERKRRAGRGGRGGKRGRPGRN